MALSSDKFQARSTTTLKHFIIIGLIIAQQQVQQIQAKRITLVPLTAPNVYRILRDTRNGDAVPHGQVVTQGVAANGALTLGLKQALAGALLHNIAMENSTQRSLTPAGSTQAIYLTQEVCFGTRRARSYEDAEAIAEAYSRLEEKDYGLKPQVRKSSQKRRVKPKRNRKRLAGYRKRMQKPQRLKSVQEDFDDTATADNSSASSAVPSTIQYDSGNEVEVKQDARVETTLSTKSQTDNNRAITCIVIQRPKQ